MTEPAPPEGALATRAALVRALRGAAIADALADDLLVRASATVRTACGWHITREPAAVFTLDGPGAATLFLPTLHLRTLTSITEDGTAVDVASLEVSRGGMVRKRSGASWTRRFSGIVATVDHGYDGVPADVAGVVITLAAKAYANPTSQTGSGAGIVSDQFGRDHLPLSLAERELLRAWTIG